MSAPKVYSTLYYKVGLYNRAAQPPFIHKKQALINSKVILTNRNRRPSGDIKKNK